MYRSLSVRVKARYGNPSIVKYAAVGLTRVLYYNILEAQARSYSTISAHTIHAERETTAVKCDPDQSYLLTELHSL